MNLTENDMIFGAGYHAGELGLTIEDCPYKKGSVKYQDWFDGYKCWVKSWLRQQSL